MAQQVLATIYGMNKNLWNEGVATSFPTQGIKMFPPPINTMSLYGIYMLAVIKALNEPNQPEYLTDKGVAQLATESNA